MHPRKYLSTLTALPRAALGVIMAFVLAPIAAVAGDRPQVVTTFTILGNWVEIVGGEHVDLTTLAPAGAEVHEWELSPRNFEALDAADIVFANGFQLEQWMAQVEATVRPDTPIIRVAEAAGYPTLAIRIGDMQGAADPHQWMDPRAAAQQVRLIAEQLATIDPDHAGAYRANAERYGDELRDLHAELDERLAVIPADRRTLITSEAALLYFAAAYEFEHHGIWGSNAEDDGTPRQMARVIDVVTEREPRALFWESTISDRYVRSVAEDTGTPVAGPLYVDSVGRASTGAESYVAMMRSNAELLVQHLGD